MEGGFMVNPDNASERIEITGVEGIHMSEPWLSEEGIPNQGSLIAVYGKNRPERTLPENSSESAADVYLDLIEGPFRLVVNPVKGGVEVSFKGKIYFTPEGRSLLIISYDPSSFNSFDEAGEEES
jgi:hypothetical protein